MAFGFDDAIMMAGLSALTGGFLGMGNMFTSAHTSYKYNQRLQDDAQRHQIKMFKNQNQWRVQDLRAAGLNPILATHSASSMPSASSNSVGTSPVHPVDLAGDLAKAQGFSSAKDMQKFARENHEVDLATKEADLAIRELTADSIRTDMELKSVNSALQWLEYDFKSQPWYKDLRNWKEVKEATRLDSVIGKHLQDFSSVFERLRYNLERSSARTPQVFIKKQPPRSTFTNYKYRYHKVK